METTIEKTDNGVLVAMNGRIDSTNYTEFESAIEPLSGVQYPAIYLDCSNLSYISSSGLRIFLTLQKRVMATGGELKIFSLQPPIKEIFDIAGFSSIFSIYPDFGSAQEKY